jgi:hypothetical protein
MCSVSQFRKEYFVWLGEKNKKFLTLTKKVRFIDNDMEKLDFFFGGGSWSKMWIGGKWYEEFSFSIFNCEGLHLISNMWFWSKKIWQKNEIVILGPTLGDGSLISELDLDERLRKLKERFCEMTKPTDGRPLSQESTSNTQSFSKLPLSCCLHTIWFWISFVHSMVPIFFTCLRFQL